MRLCIPQVQPGDKEVATNEQKLLLVAEPEQTPMKRQILRADNRRLLGSSKPLAQDGTRPALQYAPPVREHAFVC